MQKRNYAIAALDMDGTLLNSRHEITTYTRDVIRRAGRSGRIIALATGRCLSELTAHVETLDGVRYLICENGACVYDIREARSISAIALPHAEVESILERAERVDAIVQMFIDNQSYMRMSPADCMEPYHIEGFRSVFEAGSIFLPELFERYRCERPSVEKINLYFKTRQERRRFCLELQDCDVATAASIAIGVEISPSAANKGFGLETLCRHLRQSTEDAMAVGDGGNDLELMRTAGLSVAMGNAIPEVMALADAVTDDCDHDGAAKAVERFMLSE